MTAMSQTPKIKQNNIKVLNMLNVCENVHLLFMDFKYLCPSIMNKRTVHTKIY